MSTITDHYLRSTHNSSASHFKKIVLLRLVAENVLLFLLQFTGLMFSTLSMPQSPVYFATGTSCAFLLMRGNSVLPGIWLGGLLAYLLSGSGVVLAFESTTIFTLQAFLFRWLIHRYISPTIMFYQLRDFFKFIICVCLLAAVTGLLSFFIQQNTFFWAVWLANINGIFIVTIAISTLDMYFPQAPQLSKVNKVGLMIGYGCLIMLTVAILFSHHLTWMLVLGLLILSNLIMIAIKYGWCGSVAANFIVGIVFALSTYMGDSFPVPIMQILLMTGSIAGLWISIVKARLYP